MTLARAAFVPLFLAVLAAGCSGSSGPKKANPVYAGMPLSAAKQAALVEIGRAHV